MNKKYIEHKSNLSPWSSSSSSSSNCHRKSSRSWSSESDESRSISRSRSRSRSPSKGNSRHDKYGSRKEKYEKHDVHHHRYRDKRDSRSYAEHQLLPDDMAINSISSDIRVNNKSNKSSKIEKNIRDVEEEVSMPSSGVKSISSTSSQPPPPPKISKQAIQFGKPGSVAKPGIHIKLATPKTKIEPTKKITVASAFKDDSEDEVEEMPPECKMRMRNIGRDTITSSGPNSFGKTRQGFTDVAKLFEKKIKGVPPSLE